MAEYVDIEQKVEAQYYDDNKEEWIQKTVTIGQILDEICEDYKVVVDVNDVVRCKDCEKYRPYLTQFGHEPRGDGYCELLSQLDTVNVYEMISSAREGRGKNEM